MDAYRGRTADTTPGIYPAKTPVLALTRRNDDGAPNTLLSIAHSAPAKLPLPLKSAGKAVYRWR